MTEKCNAQPERKEFKQIFFLSRVSENHSGPSCIGSTGANMKLSVRDITDGRTPTEVEGDCLRQTGRRGAKGQTDLRIADRTYFSVVCTENLKNLPASRRAEGVLTLSPFDMPLTSNNCSQVRL